MKNKSMGVSVGSLRGLSSNVLLRRLRSTTPPFFSVVSKVLLAIAAAVGTATAVLFTLPTDVYSLVPIWLLKGAGITIFCMTLFGTLISNLATADPVLLSCQYETEDTQEVEEIEVTGAGVGKEKGKRSKKCDEGSNNCSC